MQEYRDAANAAKRRLRTQYRALRDALSSDEQAARSARILLHLKHTDEFRNAHAVMTYVSMGAEVRTHELIAALLRSGKKAAVPYCNVTDCTLGFASIHSIERDLRPQVLGILEPVEETRDNIAVGEIDLVVCPGLAFDRFGARLGQGKGYYDRLLQRVKGRVPVAALAYECQIAGQLLPVQAHDVTMDMIITENGIMRTAADVSHSSPWDAGEGEAR